MLPHPWRALRALVGVDLAWHDAVAPDGRVAPMGLTTFRDAATGRPRISLRRDLTQAERRSTLQHELVHVERGPVPVPMAGREEQRVRRETARRLLPDVRAIGDALAWAGEGHEGMVEAAGDLWVDVGVLRDRLVSLHPAERGYLRGRLEGAAD